MSLKDARAFLDKIESDVELKSRLLACDCEDDARKVIASSNFEFTRAELYEAAGVNEPELTPGDKEKLREMDRQLRAAGREGISPLAYTAYSLGIN
jgi:predicted ribosomally synthesized peptide with nif11-like leader